jgi:carbonic anhydrase
MTAEIEKLIDGNKEFRKKFFSQNTIFNELIVYGQRPKILIVACSDSRVDPAMIFNAQPGELFVIRNVANLVPPYESTGVYHGTSAALEFGVCFLCVNHIIVLGHTQCGGIQALVQNANICDKTSDSFIAKWMRLARPAYDKVMTIDNKSSLQEKTTLCEQYALINSLQNLESFPWIRQRINSGELMVHAWYFELATGLIHAYDQQKKKWISL